MQTVSYEGQSTTDESRGSRGGAFDNDEALASLLSVSDLSTVFGVTESEDNDELTADDAPRRTRKKRRATYLRTKDEREKLQSELATLESRVAVLKKRAGIACDDGTEQSAVSNSLLRSLVTQRQMAMASVQSLVAQAQVKTILNCLVCAATVSRVALDRALKQPTRCTCQYISARTGRAAERR